MLRPLIGISGDCFDTRPEPLRSGVNEAYIRSVTGRKEKATESGNLARPTSCERLPRR